MRARVYMCVCMCVCVRADSVDPGACNGALHRIALRSAAEMLATPRRRSNAQHHYLEQCSPRSIIRRELVNLRVSRAHQRNGDKSNAPSSWLSVEARRLVRSHRPRDPPPGILHSNAPFGITGWKTGATGEGNPPLGSDA